MSKIAMTTRMAAGFVLAIVFAGVVAAQTSQPTAAPRSLASGLFTVAHDEGVNFHVTLDDLRTAPPSRVLLRLFDENRLTVARAEVTLRPGQSTTLQAQAPGRYRAHVQVLDLPTSACDRRILLGMLEIFRVMTVVPPPTGDRPDSQVVRAMSVNGDGRGPCVPD